MTRPTGARKRPRGSRNRRLVVGPYEGRRDRRHAYQWDVRTRSTRGAWPYLETADHILHAGDVTDPALLEEMKALAPVTVVMGNCDA